MKFLTFNIVVAAALGYLLLGDKPEVRNSDIVSKLTASADAAWNKARETVSATKDVLSEPVENEPSAQVAVPVNEEAVIKQKPVVNEIRKSAPVPIAPAPLVRRAPAPKGQEVEIAKATDVPPKSAVQIDTEKAAGIAQKDPAAARRRAEVLGEQTAAAGNSEPTAVTAKFMSPRDRRRELARLAEDMELRFLDSVRQ